MEKTKKHRLSKPTDMTVGNPYSLIMRFGIPVMLGSLFQNFYNLADMAIAGHTIGDQAIAAISATSAISMIVTTVAHGINSGNAIIVAQAFGAKDMERTRKGFAAMLHIAIGTTIVLTAFALLLLGPLLSLVNTPEVLLSEAKKYITIILAGLVTAIFYNLFSSLLHALGDTKTPLYFLIISSVINIILDYVLMAIVKMGVTGAAVATVFSQLVSAVLCFIYVRKNYRVLMLTKEDLKPDKMLIGKMLPMGISYALTNSLFAIGMFAVQGAVNSLGTASITGFASGNKIRSLLCNFSQAFAGGAATFSAQNYGAGQFKRINDGVKASVLLSLIFNIVVAAIIWTVGGFLVQLVTGTTDQAVVDYAVQMMKITVPFVVAQNAVMAFRMSIQGMSGKLVPIIGTAIELVARCFCAWVLVGPMGFAGVCLGEPASWVISGIVMAACFFYIRRKREKAAEALQE